MTLGEGMALPCLWNLVGCKGEGFSVVPPDVVRPLIWLSSLREMIAPQAASEGQLCPSGSLV